MLLCFSVFQVIERPFVVNHMENPSTFPTISSHVEPFFSDPAHNEVYASSSPGEEEEDEDEENILNVSINQTV